MRLQLHLDRSGAFGGRIEREFVIGTDRVLFWGPARAADVVPQSPIEAKVDLLRVGT
jgi:hypothetical protein